MRLVFVRQRFSSFGGGELFLDRLIKALIERGTDVAVVARSWPRGANGPELIRCDPPRITRPLRDGLFARSACQVLAGLSGALVQSHERIPCCDIFWAGDGIHAAELESRGRLKSTIQRVALRNAPFHRARLRLERRLFASRRLKAVLVNSTLTRDEVVRHYEFPRERIHVIPNGIDLSRFSLAARRVHRESVRARLGVPVSRPVTLFVGSGYSRKGLAGAIEALSRSHTDAELWVVGKESWPDRYRSLAERHGIGARVRLLGEQVDPLPYYAAADMLLLPSIYDPFPSTVIEALACGLPVITSTGCGGRDVAARLDPALVRDPADVDGLAEAIDRACELASAPSTALAARAIAEDFGMPRMVDRLLSLYRELAPMAGAAR